MAELAGLIGLVTGLFLLFKRLEHLPSLMISYLLGVISILIIMSCLSKVPL